MESEKLLPCPFCGGEASLTIPSEHVQADCADIYVSCDECEAEGQHFVVEMQDRTPDLWPYEQRDAIAAWNTRAPADLRSALEAETIAFVQEWLMSSDHEPTQWDRDFAAAIDARCKRQPTDADIQAMAQRFCTTPLPESVCADLVAIKPMAGRTGTNLLTVDEAATMLRAALAAAPTIPATGEIDHG